MGLFDFFRRKKKTAAPAPSLKEIWGGFQQVLAANSEALLLMGDLEEQLAPPEELDLSSVCGRVDALDHHLSTLISALARISGDRWPELAKTWSRVQGGCARGWQIWRMSPPGLPRIPLALVRKRDCGRWWTSSSL